MAIPASEVSTISRQDSSARQADQVPAVRLLLHDYAVSVPAARPRPPDRHLAAYDQLSQVTRALVEGLLDLLPTGRSRRLDGI